MLSISVTSLYGFGLRLNLLGFAQKAPVPGFCVGVAVAANCPQPSWSTGVDVACPRSSWKAGVASDMAPKFASDVAPRVVGARVITDVCPGVCTELDRGRSVSMSCLCMSGDVLAGGVVSESEVFLVGEFGGELVVTSAAVPSAAAVVVFLDRKLSKPGWRPRVLPGGRRGVECGSVYACGSRTYVRVSTLNPRILMQPGSCLA